MNAVAEALERLYPADPALAGLAAIVPFIPVIALWIADHRSPASSRARSFRDRSR